MGHRKMPSAGRVAEMAEYYGAMPVWPIVVRLSGGAGLCRGWECCARVRALVCVRACPSVCACVCVVKMLLLLRLSPVHVCYQARIELYMHGHWCQNTHIQLGVTETGADIHICQKYWVNYIASQLVQCSCLRSLDRQAIVE